MATERIETPRLVLRRARADDLADLYAVMSREDAMRYWSTPPHASPEETRAFLQSMIEGARGAADDYVIEHAGRVVGKAGAWRLPEIGFLLAPWLWGQGLAREAMEAVIDHLFAAHDLAALTADVDPRNAASLGLLARLGFRESGRAARTMRWRDEWCDSVYLALGRGAWRARNEDAAPGGGAVRR